MQAELCIFQDDERVSLVHMLVFLEADLLDKSLHAAVDRYDEPAHLCVVRIFHASQVDEA